MILHLYLQGPYPVSRLNPHAQQMTTGSGRVLLSPPNPASHTPQHSPLVSPVQLTQHPSLQQHSQSSIHGHSSSSSAAAGLQQLPPQAQQAPPTMAFSTQELSIPPGMDFMGQFVLPTRTNDS